MEEEVKLAPPLWKNLKTYSLIKRLIIQEITIATFHPNMIIDYQLNLKTIRIFWNASIHGLIMQ
jgi:hypothetical protein